MVGKNLGEILLEQGIIDRESLERALQLQGRRLGEILIEEHLADPVAVAEALKFQARGRTHSRPARYAVKAATLESILTRLEAIEEGFDEAAGPQPAARDSVGQVRESIEELLVAPLQTVFERASLVLRQACGELNKDVELKVAGENLVVDRLLVEELSEMVLHLVRNAVDHGIEAPAERVAAGKPPRGTLTLTARQQGGSLVVTAADDGLGVNEEAVYARAFEKGLIKAERSDLSRDVLFRLLFTPGFSTRTAATGISGRGVGLDVVEAAVLRLGGEVVVASTPGEGAEFRLILPLVAARLAVVPVRAGQEWIALPATDVARLSTVTDSRGLLSARSLFSRDSRGGSPTEPGAVLLETAGGSKWAFDEVGAPEELLVRQASTFARGAHGVIGGGRMRSGKGLLVIDLEQLVPMASALE